MTFTGTKTEIQQWLYNLDKDTLYDVEINKHRNKRSLNSNAYAWKLISEISNVLRLSKEEVYLRMLRDYGQREWIQVQHNVDISRVYKYFDKIGTFKINGSVVDDYFIFIGTSNYDSREMSVFINGLVQECHNLGIETLEDIEIKEMLKEMEKEYERTKSYN